MSLLRGQKSCDTFNFFVITNKRSRMLYLLLAVISAVLGETHHLEVSNLAYSGLNITVIQQTNCCMFIKIYFHRNYVGSYQRYSRRDAVET